MVSGFRPRRRDRPPPHCRWDCCARRAMSATATATRPAAHSSPRCRGFPAMEPAAPRNRRRFTWRCAREFLRPLRGQPVAGPASRLDDAPCRGAGGRRPSSPDDASSTCGTIQLQRPTLRLRQRLRSAPPASVVPRPRIPRLRRAAAVVGAMACMGGCQRRVGGQPRHRRLAAQVAAHGVAPARSPTSGETPQPVDLITANELEGRGS